MSENFAYQWAYPSHLNRSLTSYDMGPSRFTSQPKEGVLRIFTALNNKLLTPVI
jgi:hypothetical protein